MNYKIESFKYAEDICRGNESLNKVLKELKEILLGISEKDIVKKFNEIGKNSKSISKTINALLNESLISNGWEKEVQIFSENRHGFATTKRWSMDYYKNSVQLEVAFNHEENTAWNVMKIPLSVVSNIYKHNKEVSIGIIITITNQMRQHGGFDGSVGTFEKYIEYITMLDPFIPAPILLIGLNPPEGFKIKHKNIDNKKIGRIKEVRL